jgi:hypothetical protein
LCPLSLFFMRGQKRFDALFTIGTIPKTGNKKGRDSRLLSRRNECITDRYYYYGQHTQKRYEVIMKLMSNEFFLSIDTIPEIIGGSAKQLAELKQSKPAVGHFRLKWSFMKW